MATKTKSNTKETETAMDNQQWEDVDANLATPWKPGDLHPNVLVGQYIGTDEVPGQREGEFFTSYRFEVIDDETGEVTLWGISGAALARRMERIPTGTPCRLEYKGKVQTKKGMAKDFAVQVPPGTALREHVNHAPATPAPTPSEDAQPSA